jgi:pSer/pThr/pTyr-binding forkhead associated (FHA) protein
MADDDTREQAFALLIRGQGFDDRRVKIEAESLDIGRLEDNDVCLPRGSVAKKHARLFFRKGRFQIMDLKTRQGTFVNGKRAQHTLAVTPGDEITVGSFRLVVEPARDRPKRLYRDDPVLRAELNRRTEAGDWPGVAQLLEKLRGKQAALGEDADWSLVEESYLATLERTADRPPDRELEARLWGELSLLYRDRLGNKREAHEALKVARRLDPKRWTHPPPPGADSKPPASTPPEERLVEREATDTHVMMTVPMDTDVSPMPVVDTDVAPMLPVDTDVSPMRPVDTVRGPAPWRDDTDVTRGPPDAPEDGD